MTREYTLCHFIMHLLCDYDIVIMRLWRLTMHLNKSFQWHVTTHVMSIMTAEVELEPCCAWLRSRITGPRSLTLISMGSHSLARCLHWHNFMWLKQQCSNTHQDWSSQNHLFCKCIKTCTFYYNYNYIWGPSKREQNLWFPPQANNEFQEWDMILHNHWLCNH